MDMSKDNVRIKTKRIHRMTDNFKDRRKNRDNDDVAEVDGMNGNN